MSLAKVSVKGAFWLGLLQVGIKLFSFFKLIIVARILTPTDFGLFGMIIIPYGLLEVATEPGINQALIQTKKNPQKYFSSVQIIFVLRGLFLFLTLYLLAPFIGKFYNHDLVYGIRIIALAPLIRGFINPAVILFKKNLQFKKIFSFQLLASIAESLFTIYFALKFRSMTALPLGVVIGAITATILSYLMAKFNLTAIKLKNIIELYKYGKWVTIGTLLSYLNDQGDDFVVSKILGAQFLGYYQTAYKISNLPTTQGAGLIYQIIFPIFSSIQNNLNRLKRGVVKSLSLTLIFSLCFGLFIYKFAPILTKLILGEQWLPMIPALNILIIFGVLRPLISVGIALFDSIGQPNI
ncbi:MAG: oligosaccharide flippase family protein, partial [Candidatus Beckwithbacteria bacterium]